MHVCRLAVVSAFRFGTFTFVGRFLHPLPGPQVNTADAV